MSSSKGSRAWRAVFGLVFRLTPDRLTLFVSSRDRSAPMREVIVAGRRTGLQRKVVLSVFEIGGHWYVAHPNGERAQWVRNMHASRSAVVIGRDGRHVNVVCIPVDRGSEREAVLAATNRQPFPANLVYRLARRHVTAAASCFRLLPIGTETID